MSCLHPIQIKNPSKKISLLGGQPFTFAVPCGKCSECRKAKQHEYRFRAYYESKWTYDQGGYVYFDTLTYAREHLPHLSDFMSEMKNSLLDYSCFNLEHYRYFMVSLRRQLQYHGFDPAKHLKYFLTSEYGMSETGTHRPHYHIMFFVTDPSLDPLVLSAFVRKCWPYGRTDGLGVDSEHTSQYVLGHVYGKKYQDDESLVLKVANYVSKYVTKSPEFESMIDNRFNIICTRLSSTMSDEELNDSLKVLRRQISQFHRQSQGFGLAALRPEYCTMNELESSGCLVMPDSEQVKVFLPLPNYYARHLFYELTTDFRGKPHWCLTPEGIDYKMTRIKVVRDLMTQRFQDWYDNLDNYAPSTSDTVDAFMDHVDLTYERRLRLSECKEHIRRLKSEVDSIMNYTLEDGSKRTFQDFADYLLLYRGRVRTLNSLEHTPDIDGFEIYRQGLQDVSDAPYSLYHFSSKADVENFGTKFISNKRLRLKDTDEYLYSPDYSRLDEEDKRSLSAAIIRRMSNNSRQFGDVHSEEYFIENNVYSSKTIRKYVYFDRLFNLYARSMFFMNKRKEAAFNYKEQLTNKMKVFSQSGGNSLF